MTKLNEYQINQITTNIKQFSETYKELTYKISKSNLDRKFDKAVSNLKTYINDTKKAIQDAEKAFKNAIEGDRPFFWLLSTNGLNDIINKKFSESSEVINKIIKENDDNIENIINSLPTIGKATNISGIYNSTEYAGANGIIFQRGICLFPQEIQYTLWNISCTATNWHVRLIGITCINSVSLFKLKKIIKKSFCY